MINELFGINNFVRVISNLEIFSEIFVKNKLNFKLLN